MSREYRRETYSLLEYLGDLGGLIDIIFILIAALVNTIIERQFNAAILGQTYQVQTYNQDQSEFYESSKKQKRRKSILKLKKKYENEIVLTTESESVDSKESKQ